MPDLKIGSHWKVPMLKYKLLEIIGQGSFGQVMRARNRVTNEIVAIKYIKTSFNHLIECRNVLRELSLLRQLSEMKHNIFTTRLQDIIVHSDAQYPGVSKGKGIFIVMDYVTNDMKKLLSTNIPTNFTEHHAKIILYNMLCALNFVHTANIMHRDIKPANILIDSSCAVKLCDFGLARSVPEAMISPKLQGKLSPAASPSSGNTASSSPKQVRSPQHQLNTSPFKAKEKVNKAKKPRRQLSAHVSSRWYRSPELILSQQTYNT